MIWYVLLKPDGSVRVEHHALVEAGDLILGGHDEIREARRIKDEYVQRKKEEAEADASQKELF